MDFEDDTTLLASIILDTLEAKRGQVDDDILNVAIAHLQRKFNDDEALKGLNKVLTLEPKNLSSFSFRGHMRYRLGQYQSALEDFSAVISLEPRNAAALTSRGTMKYELKQYEAALEDLNAANELLPHRDTLFLRAKVYYELNRLRDAYLDYCKLQEMRARFDKGELKRTEETLIAGEPKISFTITRLLGEGSFGKVHLAMWNGRQVALKTPLGVDQQLVIDEALTSMKFNHRNIVSAEALCRGENDEMSIVMEYAPDGSLYDLLYTRKVKLSREQILSYACDVASGLAYLHKRRVSVIHRDLKSANILLFGDVAKICDFGQSRFLNEKSVAKTITGTVNFMAPEVLAEEGYDEKADIYSFGVVLYEMCTNSTLPTIGNETKRTAKIRDNIADKQLRELITRCCKSDPKRRSDISKCLEDIIRLLEDKKTKKSF